MPFFALGRFLLVPCPFRESIFEFGDGDSGTLNPKTPRMRDGVPKTAGVLCLLLWGCLNSGTYNLTY